MQLLGRRDRLSVAVADVVINVSSDAAGQAGAKYRIQTDRELHRRALLTETRHHIGQHRRTRGVSAQNDGVDFPAAIVGWALAGQRLPAEVIGDRDWNA